MTVADEGRNLGYARVVGRKNAEAQLQDYCWPDNLRSLSESYAKHAVLRCDA